MVVEPKYQGLNFGKQILLALVDLAKQQYATDITLDARLSAVNCYQKLGFCICGVEFLSPTTGITHIPMIHRL